MSASTQVEQGQKSYAKFLKKLGKRPQSVETLAKKTKMSAGSVRRLARDGIVLGAVEATKVGNGFHYALKKPSQTTPDAPVQGEENSAIA